MMRAQISIVCFFCIIITHAVAGSLYHVRRGESILDNAVAQSKRELQIRMAMMNMNNMKMMMNMKNMDTTMTEKSMNMMMMTKKTISKRIAARDSDKYRLRRRNGPPRIGHREKMSRKKMMRRKMGRRKMAMSESEKSMSMMNTANDMRMVGIIRNMRKHGKMMMNHQTRNMGRPHTVEIYCGEEIIEFFSEGTISFAGDPVSLRDDELRFLEEAFKESYNALTFENCDNYFRSIEEVRIYYEEDEGITRYVATTSCRNDCPATEGGFFELFSTSSSGRLLSKVSVPTTSIEFPSHYNSRRKLENVCFCPAGSRRLQQQQRNQEIGPFAPTFEEFISFVNVAIQQLVDADFLHNIAALTYVEEVPPRPGPDELDFVFLVYLSWALNRTEPNMPMFIGDQDIEFWEYANESSSSDLLLGSSNLGVASATCQDVLKWIPLALAEFLPSYVILVCGANDLAHGSSPQETFGYFQHIYGLIKEKGIRLYTISTKPDPNSTGLHAGYENYDNLVRSLALNESSTGTGVPIAQPSSASLVVIDSYNGFLALKNSASLYSKDDSPLSLEGYAQWGVWLRDAILGNDTCYYWVISECVFIDYEQSPPKLSRPIGSHLPPGGNLSAEVTLGINSPPEEGLRIEGSLPPPTPGAAAPPTIPEVTTVKTTPGEMQAPGQTQGSISTGIASDHIDRLRNKTSDVSGEPALQPSSAPILVNDDGNNYKNGDDDHDN